jgi:geranylgeranyl reductase family protein
VYDVLVIGAGPAGSNISYLLSRKGLKVRLLDLKKEVGIPNHCSGLVDQRVVNIVGEDLVINRPDSAEISTPAGSFSLKSERMSVIDRVSLDKKLAEMAVSAGSDLSLGTMLIDFQQKEGFVAAKLKSKGGFEQIEARFIIGADGPTSTVRRNLRIKAPKLLTSIQYDVSKKSNRVKINLDRRETPDFFSWEIPTGREDEIGASGSGSEEAVKRMSSGETILRKRGGLIPIGPTDLGNGSGFLIGDSAGLSKATTGGGLYAALKSGEALSKAFESEGSILRSYEKFWQKSFGSEINRDYRIRKLMDRFEKHYRLWVPLAKSSLSGINKVGDVDYPSRTFLYILGSFPLTFPLVLAEFISQ